MRELYLPAAIVLAAAILGGSYYISTPPTIAEGNFGDWTVLDRTGAPVRICSSTRCINITPEIQDQ